MTDTIYRADAIETVAEDLASVLNVSKDETRELAEHALSSLPSAEAVQGEWKRTEINGYQYAVCDQCHLLADMVEKDGKLVMSMANADDEYANFCPNCGADMRKEKE